MTGRARVDRWPPVGSPGIRCREFEGRTINVLREATVRACPVGPPPSVEHLQST